jgi:nicotinamidase-related amidase
VTPPARRLEGDVSARRLLEPHADPIELEPARTAIAVLDLTVRCDDPSDVCSDLMDGLRAFLDRARRAVVPIVFTSSAHLKGTRHAEVANALGRRFTEPLIHPDGFDKFVGGELEAILSSWTTRNLIVVGSSTHVCVLYTATTAARVHRYNVIVPLDGVNTRDPLNHAVALHLLQAINGVLPRGCSPIVFSTEVQITFR